MTGRSQYPHSRAASCRLGPGSGATGADRLNTLTVGQPLVGRQNDVGQYCQKRLNTLTVGQPLVGPIVLPAQRVGESSQYPHSRAASCRDGSIGRWQVRQGSQYPHSRAASCREEIRLSGSDELRSQYPHSRAASCRSEAVQRRSRTLYSLNTLTVGQPLVGP